MSVHIVSWAWQQEVGQAGAKLVLVKLADQANDDGVCWPGQARLAKECEMGRRTVQRHLDELEAAGLLAVTRRGRTQTNIYELQVTGQFGASQTLDPSQVMRQKRQSDAPPVAHEPSVRPTSSEETSSLPHLRDPIFEELVLAWRGNGETHYEPSMRSSLTDSGKGEVNRAAKELRAINATPEQIRERAAEYRRQHPDWTFSPSAFSKWWATLESKRERLARRFG